MDDLGAHVKMWALLLSGPAHAHPQSPITLQVVELEGGTVAVSLRRAFAHREAVRVDPPPSCRATSSVSQREGQEQVDSTAWQCEGPLVGRTLALSGLRELALGALVVVDPREGDTVHALLGPGEPAFVVPSEPPAHDVLARYVGLGAWHLVSGLDHVLFVSALALLASSGRRLVATVTAFTLGHSVTLCAAALGWLVFPSAWAEVGIALTLVVVALQLLEQRAHGPTLAALFGLVHGLGFSSALAEAGLPAGARVPALFGFNAGLELAQLALVLVAWPARRLVASRSELARSAVAYAIGALACMWVLERLVGP